MAKRLRNKPPTIDSICFITGQPYAAMHEVFFGTSNSNLSKKYKMQIRLCNYYHNGDSKDSIHFNEAFRKIVQHFYQIKFNEWHEESFFDVYKKNYLLCTWEIEKYADELPEGVTLDKLQQIMYLTKGDIK